MDTEIHYESDNEIDDQKHARMLKNVLNLTTKQHVKKPTRTEPTLQVSEFNLVKSITGNKGSVHLPDLTKVLNKRASNVTLTKKLKNTQSKSKTLQKPLEKPQADRIRRTVAYENVKKQLDRWEPVITSNRAATTLRFPLDVDTKLEKITDVTAGWRLKSKLEQEIEKFEPKLETFDVEIDSKFPLTMEEMVEQRKEMAKLRKHQAYKEIKARRQNKIKSKKYRRVLRREKVKSQMKEFEMLQKTNPEEALRKLEEIERARAQERASLRHKSTGKWAKSRQVRAKYDKESRQVLAQQLSVSRDLTQKLQVHDTSDSEHEDTSNKAITNDNSDNPWINGTNTINTMNEVDKFVSGYRKFWKEQNKNIEEYNKQTNSHVGEEEKLNIKVVEDSTVNVITDTLPQTEKNGSIEPKIKNKTKLHKKPSMKKPTEIKSTSRDWVIDLSNDNVDDVFDNLEYNLKKRIKTKHDKILKVKKVKQKAVTKIPVSNKNGKISLELPKKTKKVIIDEELIENTGNQITDETNKDLNILKSIIDSKEIKTKQKNNHKHVDATPVNLETEIPDLLTLEENEEDVIQRGAISAAFEDDDIMNEFAKDKKNELKKDTPNNIDLRLPGWGSWGGKNIKMSKWKNKRFIIKFPKELPRKDSNKGDLIINENASVKIKSHLVSELPFPFKSVKDFEASVRAPIGNTFVTETAFRKLTQPAVVTKLGTVIEPMTEDILLKKRQKEK